MLIEFEVLRPAVEQWMPAEQEEHHQEIEQRVKVQEVKQKESLVVIIKNLANRANLESKNENNILI